MEGGRYLYFIYPAPQFLFYRTPLRVIEDRDAILLFFFFRKRFSTPPLFFFYKSVTKLVLKTNMHGFFLPANFSV